MTARTKVLYIAGRGRSGSTILDNALGQIDGYFSAGELRLRDRVLSKNDPCGCARGVWDCDIWRAVMREVGAESSDEVRSRFEEFRRTPRAAHLPLLFVPGGEAWLRRRFRAYLAATAAFYRALRRVTGARVIVDSSKYPPYGRLLQWVEEIDLYVVHLVRDARAVTFSWDRQRRAGATGDALYRRQIGLPRSWLHWTASNVLAETLLRRPRSRYRLVRYEDLVTRPREAVARIVEFVGEPAETLPFVSENEIEMQPGHSMSGNPSRFRSGTVTLRVDDAWEREMAPMRRRILTTLAWPMLKRYGYLGSAKGPE